jgi:hypothetical protein
MFQVDSALQATSCCFRFQADGALQVTLLLVMRIKAKANLLYYVIEDIVTQGDSDSGL